jgi:hypothetical protein
MASATHLSTNVMRRSMSRAILARSTFIQHSARACINRSASGSSGCGSGGAAVCAAGLGAAGLGASRLGAADAGAAGEGTADEGEREGAEADGLVPSGATAAVGAAQPARQRHINNIAARIGSLLPAPATAASRRR